MNTLDRDTLLIQSILRWGSELEEAHRQFEYEREAFNQNSAYRNAVSMCIFQICELTGRLSEDFRAVHAALPWPQIRGMRNLFAHDYGNMALDAIWQTAIEDIPALCRALQE